jgi:hypothetical protein
VKKTGLIHRIGRATIASGLVFAASLALWISQRVEDEPRLEYPAWPDISWVIVTTTSTSTTLPAPTTTEPKPETTKPKRTTTTSSTPPTTIDPLSSQTTTVEVGNPTSTVSVTTSALG